MVFYAMKAQMTIRVREPTGLKKQEVGKLSVVTDEHMDVEPFAPASLTERERSRGRIGEQ